MRVGFGVTLLARGLLSKSVDGIGSYTRELLLRHVQSDAVEVHPVSFGISPASDLELLRHTKVLGNFAPSAALAALSGKSFGAERRLLGNLDVMHATDHLIPKLQRIPVVATIFDAVPLSHPEWVPQRLRYAKAQLWRYSARWAQHIITISEFSRLQILEYFGIPEKRVTVVPLGVDERWFRSLDIDFMGSARDRLKLPDHFFLFIGTLQPRKNLAGLISAYSSLPRALKADVPLVIVGRAGWGCEDLVAELNSGKHGSSVRWLQRLSDDDLLAVMKFATALVLPSLYEGFGLPVLEAFASGVPVITSNKTSLPEVAGDAAVLVTPTDVSDIAEAMMRLLDSPSLREELRGKGLARAREFSWDRTAKRTREIYRQVL